MPGTLLKVAKEHKCQAGGQHVYLQLATPIPRFLHCHEAQTIAALQLLRLPRKSDLSMWPPSTQLEICPWLKHWTALLGWRVLLEQRPFAHQHELPGEEVGVKGVDDADWDATTF